MKYSFTLILFFAARGLLAQETITVSDLRKSQPAASVNTVVYITDPGRQGLFRCDPLDKALPDDSAMTLVTGKGLRFKRIVDQDRLNVQWFGATGNGVGDDWYAIQKGITYILNNAAAARTLYFPPGVYLISRPLIIARLTGARYLQASINLLGPANARDLAVGSARIIPFYNNSFVIGIQSGKGVEIRNLVLRGRFTFPDRLNAIQVDTLGFNEWTDGSARDNRLSPYAGIVIDPFSDSTVYPHNSDMYPGLHGWCQPGIGRGGSTAVQVIGCSITNFIVGMMITPSNQQNGELVDLIDCDLGSNKVGYAMGQAQSKECHVVRLKCWGPTHTLFDNVTYGFRHGDGAAVPMVDGVNIAGSVKQLCRIYAASFGGSFRNVYTEGLFRIGYVGGFATVAFEDCQINFATESPGKPYPDFFLLGSDVTFHNCMLRSYTGQAGMRLILSGTNDRFEGGTMNEPPIAVNLDNNAFYSSPSFENVVMYYQGGILGGRNPGRVSAVFPIQGSNGRAPDPVYDGNTYFFRDPFYGVDLVYKLTYTGNYERLVRINGAAVIHADKSDWTARFKLPSPSDTSLLRPGDFVMTSRRPYQDEFADIVAPTYPVGIIQSIRHDTVCLRNLAIGITEGMKLYMIADYYVNAAPLFTGDIASGSNKVVHVQGVFPVVGDRPDMPMLPSGSYVTAVDANAGTVTFSTSNTHGSFTDFTFMNGYPAIEMYSSYDLPELRQSNKTLIGGATFYRYDATNINTHEHDYPLAGPFSARFKVLNTNIKGDTTLHKFRYVSLAAGQFPDNPKK